MVMPREYQCLDGRDHLQYKVRLFLLFGVVFVSFKRSFYYTTLLPNSVYTELSLACVSIMLIWDIMLSFVPLS